MGKATCGSLYFLVIHPKSQNDRLLTDLFVFLCVKMKHRNSGYVSKEEREEVLPFVCKIRLIRATNGFFSEAIEEMYLKE